MRIVLSSVAKVDQNAVATTPCLSYTRPGQCAYTEGMTPQTCGPSNQCASVAFPMSAMSFPKIP